MKSVLLGAACAILLVPALAGANPAGANPADAKPPVAKPAGERRAAEKPAVVESAAVARIDALLREGLAKEGIDARAEASDEVFVRRVHLDLIGRIPTKDETLAFLESEDPAKRAALVDALVGSEGYVSHQYNWFADLLRMRTAISGNNQSIGAGMAYARWIKDAIRQNRPYDEVVYDLVTASGTSWENPAIGYYLRDFGMSLDNLAITTQVFLGTQIVCAQCHNHPFEAWTQKDYYHLAAFTYGLAGSNGHPVQAAALELAREERRAGGRPAAGPGGGQAKGAKAKGKGKGKGIGKGKGKGARRGMATGEALALRKASSEILFPLRFNKVVATDRQLRLPGDYRYDDAKALSRVSPVTLFGKAAVLSDDRHPVEAFGEWLTSPENPRFTRVIANRLWKRAFGLGLVEPVDDFKDNQTGAYPDLLAYLEELMISLDYDLQAFQRILYKTEAYQREAVLEEPVPGVPFHFAGPILRRMSAEQIWDSLVAMTVENPDQPDSGRELVADRKLAEVQLIAESLFDQSPAEFLANMREVVGIQAELSQRIEVAVAEVAKARETGNADLIKQASQTARAIKRELDDRIEEVVYREGLARKLAALPDDSRLATASGMEVAPGETLVAHLAGEIPTGEIPPGDRGVDEGMGTSAGGERRGFIDEMVSTLFAEREEAVAAERAERRRREALAWKVETREDRGAYRIFNRFIRSRMARASELSQPAPAGHFLREFGQSDRELVENSNDEAAVTQALALLNGQILGSVTNRYSVLMRDMSGEKFSERLETVYLTMLSRLPTAEERAIFREAWAADPESGTVKGIVWTVLNTRQFLFVQ